MIDFENLRPHTSSTNGEISCPHGCGAVIAELWDFDWERNPEQITECPECEKPITITRELRVKYTAFADSLDEAL